MSELHRRCSLGTEREKEVREDAEPVHQSTHQFPWQAGTIWLTAVESVDGSSIFSSVKRAEGDWRVETGHWRLEDDTDGRQPERHQE